MKHLLLILLPVLFLVPPRHGYGAYRNPPLPDIRTVMKIFFSNHTSVPPGGISYAFEKRPEGWFVRELIPEGLRYRENRADTLWLLKTRQYQTIGRWEKWNDKQEQETPDYDRIIGSASDYMMYTYAPAYGYAGWEDDVIRLLNPVRAELDDTMLYVLARAYSDKASDVYYDRYLSAGPGSATRKKLPDPEKLKAFIAGEQAAIELYGKIKDHNKDFPTAAGRIGMKWCNELMFTYLMAQVFGRMDATEARRLLRPDMYDPFLLQAARKIMTSVPQNAVLFTSGDNDLYPLLYLQAQSRFRSDVRIVSTGLLSSAEYIAFLQKDLFGKDALKMNLPPSCFTGRQSPYILLLLQEGRGIRIRDLIAGLKANSFYNADLECSVLATAAFIAGDEHTNVTWSSRKEFITAADVFMMDIIQNSERPVLYYTPDRNNIPVFPAQFVDEGLLQEFAYAHKDSAHADRIKTSMISLAQLDGAVKCPEHRHLVGYMRSALAHLVQYKEQDKIKLSVPMLEHFQKNMLRDEYFAYPDDHTLKIAQYCYKIGQGKLADLIVKAALDHCETYAKTPDTGYFEVFDQKQLLRNRMQALRQAKQEFTRIRSAH